jgi:hypothetical protein
LRNQGLFSEGESSAELEGVTIAAIVIMVNRPQPSRNNMLRSFWLCFYNVERKAFLALKTARNTPGEPPSGLHEIDSRLIRSDV